MNVAESEEAARMIEDQDLQDVLADETSRGSRRPHKGLTKERLRNLRKAANMLSDKRYGREDYLKVLRDGLGLREHSAEYRRFVKVWSEYRGNS